jgi:predicted hydrocarbon binding protein
MKNLKYKGLKYDKGIYSLYNNRYVFFPPKVLEVLSSIYGEGVKSLLVWLGKKAGWNLAQNWEEYLKPKNLNDLVDDFFDIFNHQGWGILNPTEISEDKITIEFENNISAELENKSKSFCYFIKGLLSGFGEFALYKVEVTESNCCIDNPKTKNCEFLIRKIK